MSSEQLRLTKKVAELERRILFLEQKAQDTDFVLYFLSSLFHDEISREIVDSQQTINATFKPAEESIMRYHSVVNQIRSSVGKR